MCYHAVFKSMTGKCIQRDFEEPLHDHESVISKIIMERIIECAEFNKWKIVEVYLLFD